MPYRLFFSLPNATRSPSATRSIVAFFVLALLSLVLSTPSCFASTWEETNQAGTIKLIVATQAVGDLTALDAGFAFDLKPGWKIYWRLPGDAGYPPKATWNGSTNISPPEIEWPAPGRFVEAGLQSIGYHDHVVLPLTIAVTVPGSAVHLAAQVDYLACAKVCVPLNADFEIDLPAGAATPSAFADTLKQARTRLPTTFAQATWAIDQVEMYPDGPHDTLRVRITGQTPFAHPDLFIEDGSGAPFAIPDVVLDNGDTRATLTVAKLDAALRGKPLILTLVDGGKSAQATVTPALVATPAPTTSHSTLLPMLAIAFLGGLILNLMPCVLPILSLKILAIIRLGGAERAHARSAFLASSAGIIVSFIGLAILLIGLKLAGHTVGWGWNFQHPLFLAVMIAVLTLFAANLWGLFHIPLPAFLGGLAMDDQGRPVGGHGLAGHFLSGLFATLLATPCSAPFLGTAIGFALGNGPQEILLIFTTMGLGLATPFLTLSAFPHLATRLPRPGAWMVYVTKALAVALAATAVWLGLILFGQLWGHSALSASDSTIPWTRFEQTKIAQAVATDKVVFIDITADWCISCKVNKLTVIERGDVAARLKSADMVNMEGDWTLPNDDIAHYLESFGRYGIPFNAVYGPKAPNGIALSELPSSVEILDAIAKAKGGH